MTNYKKLGKIIKEMKTSPSLTKLMSLSNISTKKKTEEMAKTMRAYIMTQEVSDAV